MVTSAKCLWAWLSQWSSRACLLPVALVACEPNKDPGVLPEPSAETEESLISDEFHSNGTPGFAFLPPMVPPPASYGNVVPDLPVMVRVDELTAGGRTLRTLATFTKDGGPEREAVRVHVQNNPAPDDGDGDADPHGYYYVRWHTDDAHLSASARYRVRVLVPARIGRVRELGYADVDVVTTSREYRSVNAQAFTPLLNGRTLRIKFRIDWRAVDEDRDGIFDWRDSCPSIANPDQMDSMHNGTGDACRCARKACPPADSCHDASTCLPQTGRCTERVARNGSPCSLPNANGTCSNGICQLTECFPLHADCNRKAVDGCEIPTASQGNCGDCGVVCSAGANSTPVCVDGHCGLSCNSGYADCDGLALTGCERNIADDPLNCGACGVICSGSKSCIHGACTTATCQTGTADCDEIATNGCETQLATDPQNCGACGNACNVANALTSCNAGTCVIAHCSPRFGDCNGVVADGCETDLGSDTLNCGACSSPCSLPNASGLCIAGICTISSCHAGFADCDALEAGCEVDLTSNPSHCGSCNNACAVAHAGTQCISGICVPGTCEMGYADCNGQTGDGCESKLAEDRLNCGACGNTCASGTNAQSICVAGTCGLSCDSGYADCDQDSSNGCETDLQASCSTCGSSCSLPNAVGQCVAGVCTFSVCQPGYADCDGESVNGCEVNLNSDETDCGGCGAACAEPDPHVTANCVNGKCDYIGCEGGSLNCNLSSADGCEANILMLCGSSCANSCRQYETCSNGTCVCPGPNCGFGECCPSPGYCMVGVCNWEALATDPNNCGALGHVCETGASCVYGYCVNFQTDPALCGGFGNVCGGTAPCVAGQCVYEDDANCGRPGVVCPAPATCQAQQCVNGTVTVCGTSGTPCPSPNVCFPDGRCFCPSLNDLACDGVCPDFESDPNNCGKCGIACPQGVQCLFRKCETPGGTLSLATSVSAGYDDTCAILAGGSVHCWGWNLNGELGNERADLLSVGPVAVSGLSEVIAIGATGNMYSCAVLNTGTVHCWGNNDSGQLGDGTFYSSRTPVAISGLSQAIGIAVGGKHVCALLNNGTVQCWGANESGQLGNGTQSASGIPLPVSGISSAIGIAAGTSHSCALLSGGAVLCWGSGNNGKLGNGTTNDSSMPVTVVGLSQATAISAESDHSCAILGDGMVQCWGSNDAGQLGNGTLQSSTIPVTVSGLSGARGVSAGASSTCAILGDGTVQCWGMNDAGQLGNGTTSSSAIPVTVSGLSGAGAIAIAVGRRHACSVLGGGSIKCWGWNGRGQLGNCTITDSLAPVFVFGSCG